RGLLGGKDPHRPPSTRHGTRASAVTAAARDGNLSWYAGGRAAVREGTGGHPSPATSLSVRRLRAWSVGSGVLSLPKWPGPSAKAKLAPPGWPLPKAQFRSSSVEKSPPGGTR